jgi:hypothetical protein
MSGLSRGGFVLANGLPFTTPAPVTALHLDHEEARHLGWELVEADLVDTAAEWPQHSAPALEKALAGLV